MAPFLLMYSFIILVNSQDIFDNSRQKSGCRNTLYLEDKMKDLQEQIGYLNDREVALQKDLDTKNKLNEELQAQLQECNHPGTTDVFGRHFLIVFLRNYQHYAGRYTHFLLNSNRDGWYYLDVPYLGIKENRSLRVGNNVFNLSTTINPTSFVIENKGIWIETSTDVNVYALNIEEHISDGFYVIPIKNLSTKYIIVTDDSYGLGQHNSGISVSATENDTTINFSFHMNGTINYKQQVYDRDKVLTVQLNRYETFQIEHNHDLTGTIVTSNKPIAVVSGTRCGDVTYRGCSHLAEMMTPVISLGKRYIIPVFTSSFDERAVRIVAVYNNTIVNYSIGGIMNNVNITSSSFIIKLIDKSSFMFVSSSKPVLVTVFVQGSFNPFMVIIPDVNQYLSNYTFSVPDAGFTSNLSMIMKTTSLSGIRFDRNLMKTSCSLVKMAFQDEEYCLMEISVLPGSHNLQHLTNDKFGLFVYGHRRSDGYGYLGGMKFNES